MVEYNVIIEKDEDGWYVARVGEIPGCYTQGRTIDEAIERIKEAIEVCIVADGITARSMQFIGVQKVEVADGKAS